MILSAADSNVSVAEPVAWYALDAGEVLQRTASVAEGLTSSESARRLELYGRNEIARASGPSVLKGILNQFKSLLIWILLIAAVITAVLGDRVDCVAILTIVILNAAFGFYQEFSAEKSIAALRQMTAPQCRIRRDGAVVIVSASGVVPGDILEVEAGDILAADARLLSASSLRCVEAALTGENEAVDKDPGVLLPEDALLGDRKNMLFTGTAVASGQGRAVVVATGIHSELGRIAQLLGSAAPADERTPLQKRLTVVGRWLVWFCLGIVALMFVLGLLRGTAPLELFMTSVSLAVAAVPESLPAAVTVALGLGVLRMSRRKALVRRLPAVETLGSTNIICTDKTGTLTAGEMTVRELYVAGTAFEVTGEGYGPHGEVLLEGKAAPPSLAPPLLLLAEILIGSNNAELVLEEGNWIVAGDPTEAALLRAGQKAGVQREHLEMKHPRHYEIPFDSDRKRRTVVRLGPDNRLRAHINGAPDVLLRHCTQILTEDGVQVLSAVERDRIHKAAANMADRALRVLGSAYRDLDHAEPQQLTAESVERDLIFAGLAGMYDPPRSGVKEAILKCRGAGIRVVMITGDHPHTARAIARELGIGEGTGRTLNGAEIDALSERQLESAVHTTDIYARVTAAHKLRIVKAWQVSGAVVAMTGDGVNDAPAIKGADIGIAMGRTGTEVTRQAADMVITDDDFSTIVAAVEEGRGIFDNIRKSLLYLLAGSCGELILMLAAVLAGLPAPLLPIHLLWINLVTDGLPALCLATGSISPNVMEAPPLDRNAVLTDRRFVRSLLITGLLTAAVTFGTFFYSLQTAPVEVARTRAFATLVFAELLRGLAARDEKVPVWKIGLKANPWLVAVTCSSIALQIFLLLNKGASGILHTILMPFGESLLLLALGALPLLLLQFRHISPFNGLHRKGLISEARPS